MGANHVGEIDYLSSLARPDVAIVNNVGPAHLEGFGSLDNIAKAKAEIYDGLVDDGIAVINRDDVYYPFWNDYCADKYMRTFSMTDGRADVFARQLTEDVYLVLADGEQAELKLEVPGKHNVMNALAAITVTSAATRDEGLSLASIVDSLSQFENINGRLTALESDRGFKVYDDSYNANPLSVSAAIDVLADMKPSEAGNTVLVLGDMAELGDEAEAMHHEMGMKAKQAGIDQLYTTGVLSANTADAFGDNGFYFEDKDELIAALDERLADGDVVLVKGSRSAAMEKVVERILTHENNNKRVN
jgi:UDP-N-acetylmuramoyl-tripeptide--D-alanyl-D-alanine ligase